MKKERAVGSKIKFALAAVFVVTVLSTMTLLFVQGQGIIRVNKCCLFQEI